MNLGKVVAVHPEQHSVDILILDDGRRLAGVPVVTTMGSSSSGLAGLVTPDSQSAADPFDAPSHSGRDIIAVVGFYGMKPVVLGFLFPEVSQCLFPDADRYINRTASDVYWTVDGNGNAELFHPSGAYIRLGTSAAHEDLTGKDYDKVFNASRNADKAVNIHIAQKGNVATVNIAPDGEIMVTSNKNISVVGQSKIYVTASSDINIASNAIINMTAAGILNLSTQATLNITSTGALSISSPNINASSSTFAVTGNITVTGNISTTNGNFTTTNGNVTAGTVQLKTHTHKGVQTGSGNTGSPN